MVCRLDVGRRMKLILFHIMSMVQGQRVVGGNGGLSCFNASQNFGTILYLKLLRRLPVLLQYSDWCCLNFCYRFKLKEAKKYFLPKKRESHVLFSITQCLVLYIAPLYIPIKYTAVIIIF